MRRGALRDNSLSIVFGALFLVTAAAQSLAGWRVEVQQAAEHGEGGVSYWTYVSSSSFGRALLENWQSEYLQFVLFILLTVWLTQLGSPESKQPGDEGLGTDEDQLVGEHAPPGAPKWAVVNDLRRSLYSMSLLIVMSTLFLLSWLGQSVTGWRVYNDEAAQHAPRASRGPASWCRQTSGSRRCRTGSRSSWRSGRSRSSPCSCGSAGRPSRSRVGAPHAKTDVSG